ncbi:MAG TPA: hypothetical protein VHX65_11745 [Pirellulales bacterium]|jgi:hypothetical protein|nr:hypothetical protein [Pirellulales bacterium]
MIALLGGVASAILCLASISGIGYQLARLLRAGESSEARAARPGFGWAFLLGSAAVGLVLQIPLAIDGRITHRSFAVVGMVGMAAVGWTIVGWWRSGLLGKGAWFDWLSDLPMLGRLLALVSIAAAFVYCCRTDLTGYDARTIYALKARVLYDTGTIRGEDFQDIHRVHFNPAYPLLLPLVEAQIYWTHGSYVAPGLKLLFLLFPLALASLYAGELRRFGTRGFAAMAALLLLSTPLFLECFEGAALSGSADLPLAALILGGVLELSRWIRRPGWQPALCAALLLGAAAATKSEGMLWTAACAAGLAGTWLLRPSWPSGRRLATAVAGMVTLVVVAVVRDRISRQVPDSPYYPSYWAALDWRWIMQLADRPAVVFRYAAVELVRTRTWNLMWPCVIGSLVLLRRSRLPASVWFWRLTALAGIGASIFALVITPLHLEYELRTSFSRLLLHAFPLAALIMAEQMAASGWSGQLAQTMRADQEPEGQPEAMQPDAEPRAKAA